MAKEKVINIRITEQQYEKIQQCAASCSMKLSEYARHMMTTDISSLALYNKQQIMEVLSDMSNTINNVCELLGADHSDIYDSLEEGVSKICHILN